MGLFSTLGLGSGVSGVNANRLPIDSGSLNIKEWSYLGAFALVQASKYEASADTTSLRSLLKGAIPEHSVLTPLNAEVFSVRVLKLLGIPCTECIRIVDAEEASRTDETQWVIKSFNGGRLRWW